MGSTWAFKITASLIKPTREALLDYCSYILLIVSIISIARVVIGRQDLRADCYDIAINNSRQSSIAESGSSHFMEESSTKLEFNISNSDGNNLENNKSNNERTIASDLDKTMPRSKPNLTKKVCPKFYQAYFPYFLLVESCIFLLIGIFWVKMPKVLSLVNDFSKLLHQCQSASWLKSIANHTHLAGSTGLSQSLYSAINSDTASMEVQVLIEALFHQKIAYKDKSQARSLFEKVQSFCLQNKNSKILWRCYIRKSLYQLLLWLLFFSVNMLLFVKLEFYIGCNTTDIVCDHDTFLRIIWFMVQLIIVLYGMLNCNTLKWINDNSVLATTKGSPWSPLAYGCCMSFIPSHKQPDAIVCQPFWFSPTQEPVHNDVALLLHFVSSAKRKMLPHFTIFLFDQWNEKLQQSDETVQLRDDFSDNNAYRGNYDITRSNSAPPVYLPPLVEEEVRHNEDGASADLLSNDTLPLYKDVV